MTSFFRGLPLPSVCVGLGGWWAFVNQHECIRLSVYPETLSSPENSSRLFPVSDHCHNPWRRLWCLFGYSLVVPALKFHINELIQYLLLCIGLISLSILSLRFIHVVECISRSAPFNLWTVLYHLYQYNICFAILLLIDTWNVFSLGLLQIKLLWTF